jgi:nucleoside-diphosphate-sugar epimerase
MADAAACAVAAVDNPQASNQTILISDPAPHTWTEVVAVVGQTVGQPLPVNYVAPGAPIPLLPEAMGSLLAGMELADTELPSSDGMAALGVRATPLAAFAQRFFGAP